MATPVESVVEDKKDKEKPIDREKTCPLLLRVFISTGRHHPLSDYSRGNVPANELQIYTWMDATLKELTSLVKEVNPDARRKGTYFDFALVIPDHRGIGCRMTDIGSTCSGQKGVDDNKTLSQCRFQIGDFMDIAISPPPPRGSFGSRRGRSSRSINPDLTPPIDLHPGWLHLLTLGTLLPLQLKPSSTMCKK